MGRLPASRRNAGAAFRPADMRVADMRVADPPAGLAGQREIGL